MYQYFKIKGNNELKGEIKINGAKNSVLPLMIATVFAKKKFILSDVPHIKDVNIISNILEIMGSDVYYEDVNKENVVIDNTNMEYKDLIYKDVSKLRASYYFIGALVGAHGKAKILLPGGCFLGPRPIDLHIKGFEILGCNVKKYNEGNYEVLEVNAPKGGMKGTTIFLDFPSVGATINLMFAALGAKGETIIENAAKEPEIVDVSMILNQMGAKIKGAGTDKIRVEFCDEFKGVEHTVVPDRIEAGTYLMIGSILSDDLRLTNVIPEHLEAVLLKFKEIGFNYEIGDDYIQILKRKEQLTPVEIKTGVYPSFPTDLQQIATTVLTQIKGNSKVMDSIYPKRFRNCNYLNQMGADITLIETEEIGKAEIIGGTKLLGQEIIATDLRAGAGLVLAALIAEGESKILEISHILRGYDNIISKLKNIGADIELIKEDLK